MKHVKQLSVKENGGRVVPLTSRENDRILVKKDFLVRYIRSSSTSSPSIIAQLSAVGNSHSLPPELIINVEYLYCSLHLEEDRNSLHKTGFGHQNME